MPENSILNSTSFSGLDIDGQMAVCNLFNDTYESNDPTKKLALDYSQLFSARKSLTVSLAFYGDKLDKTNKDGFEFMSAEDKYRLVQDLLFAFYIFSAKYQLDEIEDQRQDLPQYSKQIKRCAYLINELRMSGQVRTPESLLDRAIRDSDKHAKYLGLTVVAPLVAALMMGSIEEHSEQWERANKTGFITSWMSALNARRLGWVWQNALLGSVFAMLPEDFAHRSQAVRAVGTMSPITGYMSWILYYARFGIQLSLLLKHTIAGPWMSAEERKIPAWERFKTQWDQRKFALLNDSIWATANMACFLWLIGSGMFGYLGNVTTTALLIMDLGLTVWRYYEEDTQHNKDMERYRHDIDTVHDKINALTADEDSQRTMLEKQLIALQKAQAQCKMDWDYKKYGIVSDLVYAASLIIAFSLMCSLLFPPAMIVPATALILGLAGAALCFVLNTAYTAVGSGLEIAKMRGKSRLAKAEYNDRLQEFVSTDNEFVKKQLYLDMKALRADSAYQEHLIHIQKIKLVNAVLTDALIPSIVFVSMVFMPLGIGLIVLAAGLALAVISHYLLKEFAVDAPKLPEMNEDDYANFERLHRATTPPPIVDPKRVGLDKSGFFCKGGTDSQQQEFDNGLVPRK